MGRLVLALSNCYFRRLIKGVSNKFVMGVVCKLLVVGFSMDLFLIRVNRIGVEIAAAKIAEFYAGRCYRMSCKRTFLVVQQRTNYYVV
jgi:hypothetical protein